jgi:hypothetical protein
MKIIERYSDSNILSNAEITTERFQKSVYSISTTVTESIRSRLTPGKTTVLFSGGWRFDFDAIYLESKSFSNSKILSNKKTYFVEPNNTKLFNKVMHDMHASNILILHSGFFCNYQPLDKIIAQMKQYWQFHPKQIILSVPQEKINFNRLKYCAADLAEQYQAEIIDNCFVVQLTEL